MAAGVAMLAFGDFAFGLSTAAYQRLERHTRYMWAEIRRLGRNPALQYTGPGGERITLRGVLLPGLGDHGSLETLRAIAAAGEPRALAGGDGQIHGRWVVQQISESQGEFFADGVPRRREFTLELALYGERTGAQ